MFRLIHISDLHLSPLPQPSWRELAGKRITGYLNWKLNRRNQMEKGTFDALVRDLQQKHPDHIAISGDIVNLSLASEFAQARKRIAGLGPAEDVSLVPGNHDAYVPGAFNKACEAFAPWIKGDETTGVRPFPYMRVRGEVAIIGVSSAIAMPPFAAAGYFGARQAWATGALLRQAEEAGLFRIVMIHHPPLYDAGFWHMRLWGIRRFRELVRLCGAELVLHGHTHLPTLSFITGKDGRVPVVGVSSASQDFGGYKPPAGYNLFTIGRNGQQGWQCHFMRYALVDHENTIDMTMCRALYS